MQSLRPEPPIYLPFKIRIIALLTIAIASTYIIYLPGLSGPFMLDDWVNLDRLEIYSKSKDDFAWVEYILKGTDPLDRPLSRLSFLIDDNTWPSDPENFKRTNLHIHAITGLIIFSFFLTIGRSMLIENKRNYTIAVFAAGYWLLHPLYVSTTLYVVQRMAQLAAMFTVLGITLYMQARLRERFTWQTAVLIFLSGLSLLAGVLSKQNAFAAPLMIGILELTIMPRRKLSGYQKYLRIFFCIVPSIVVISAFIYHLQQLIGGYAIRDFSLSERLLTQTRVLLDYIGALILPNSNALGLYQDDFEISKSLINPKTTLLCTFTILMSLLFAVFLRKRQPIASLGIAFFLISHVIESSFIPLEIYFEHRNYLPGISIIYAMFFYIFQWKIGKESLYKGAYACSFALIISAAYQTHILANIWSSQVKIYEHATIHHYESDRLRKDIIQFLLFTSFKKGSPESMGKAKFIIEKSLEKFPNRAALLLEEKIVKCSSGEEITEDPRIFAERIEVSEGDTWMLKTFLDMLSVYRSGACDYPNGLLQSTFNTIENHHGIIFKGPWAIKIYNQMGALELDELHFEKAITHYRKQWSLKPSDERLALLLARLEFSTGNSKNSQEYAQIGLNLHRSKGISSFLDSEAEAELEELVKTVPAVNIKHN